MAKQIVWTVLVSMIRLGLDLLGCWSNKYRATLRLNRTTLDVFFAGFTLSGVLFLKTNPPSAFYRMFGINSPGEWVGLLVAALFVAAICVVIMQLSGEKIISALYSKREVGPNARKRLFALLGVSYIVGFTLLFGAVAFLSLE